MTSDKPQEINQAVAVKIDLDALKAAGASEPAMEALLKENARKYARHVDAWMAEFKPVTPSEIQLIRHAAALAWKLDRADRYEEAAVAQRTSDTILACLYSSQSNLEHAVSLASFDPSSEAERVRRYRLAVHRELRRDLESFAKLKLQSEKQNPPAAKDSTEAARRGSPDPADTLDLARRGSPDPADTLDRRSPAPGQGVDTPRSPVSSARRGSPDPADTLDLARRGSPDPAETVDRRSPAPGQGVDTPRSPESSTRHGSPAPAQTVAPPGKRPLNPREKRRPDLEQILKERNRRDNKRPSLEQILKERKRGGNNQPEVPQFVKVGNWSLAETSFFS